MTIEEIHDKLRICERDKHDAVHKMESMHLKLQREQNRFDTERSLIISKSEETYRRLRNVERDLESTKESRVAMLKKIATIEHERKDLAESKEKQKADYEAELDALKQKLQDQHVETGNKFDALSETHARTLREMQQLLADQKKMGDKW